MSDSGGCMWRLYVATQAKRIGTGGISRVAREAGVTRETIHNGMQELQAGELYEPGSREVGYAGCLGYLPHPRIE